MSTPPKVAVIMPAYNAQEYIEASVKSILSQDLPQLSLIVVNDGSKDDTEAVLRRIAGEDQRLIALTVENGGPAMARNQGLELVPEGTEYIMFADSDDELVPGAISYALENARGADLVLMGFTIVNADGSEAGYFEPQAHLDASSIGEKLGQLYKANLLNQVWAKLFRAELVQKNHIRFPDYRWGEDRLFIYDCLENARSVSVLPRQVYRYIMHPGESLITRYYDKKPEVCLKSDLRMQELCSRFGVQEDGDFRYMFIKSIFSCLTTLFAPTCDLSTAEKRSVIKEIIRNEQVRSRSKGAFGGVPVKVLSTVIATGNVTLNYMAFYAVAFAGTAAPKLFTKIKHKK